MTLHLRLALVAGMSALLAAPGWAQDASRTNMPPTAAAKAANPAAAAKTGQSASERAAEAQRRAGEAQFKRRDEAMRRSMKGICSGC